MQYSHIISEIKIRTNTTQDDSSILRDLDIFKASYLYKNYVSKSKLVPSSYYQSFIIELSEGELIENYISKVAELPLKQLDGTTFKYFGNTKSYYLRKDFEDVINVFSNLQNKSTPCYYPDFTQNNKSYKIIFPSKNLITEQIRVEGIFVNPFDIANPDNDTYPIESQLLQEYLKNKIQNDN